jgi:hypothetical protein
VPGKDDLFDIYPEYWGKSPIPEAMFDKKWFRAEHPCEPMDRVPASREEQAIARVEDSTLDVQALLVQVLERLESVERKLQPGVLEAGIGEYEARTRAFDRRSR